MNTVSRKRPLLRLEIEPKEFQRKPSMIRRSSFKDSYTIDTFELPPLTPTTLDKSDITDCIFPQYLPKGKYDKDKETQLRSYEDKKFVYESDCIVPKHLQDFDMLNGINSPKVVILDDKNRYIYKKSYLSEQYLPKGHSRTLHSEQRGQYHSHSRVMIQIMSRNLLKFLLENEQDIIIPEMYPVVDNGKHEVCGLISKISECCDYGNLQQKVKRKEISQEDRDNKQNSIDKQSVSMGLPIIAKIIGITDLVQNFTNIKNVGLTKEGKLVFFDFGSNILYEEENLRLSLKTDDTYGDVVLKLDNETNDSLKNPFKYAIDTYIRKYDTSQYGLKDNRTVKKVHPDIEKIVLNTGPGNLKFRKKLAKLIQVRINNAVSQADRQDTPWTSAHNPSNV